MKKYRRKITPEQGVELLEHLKKHGNEASFVKCREYGVDPYYAIRLANALGIKTRKYRGGGNIAKSVDHNDPRWKWAIERGPVRV